MIYFNQATTSYPKPKEVTDEMIDMLTNIGGSPGRSTDKSQGKAANVVEHTRKQLAKNFGCSNSNKVLFFQNATVALNQAIKGLSWKKGDHLITTTFEHNSVRRPIHYLQETYGVEVTYINPLEHSHIEKAFKQAITNDTKAIIVTHACNVTGDVLPIEKIGEIARDKNIVTVVDASQSAGHLAIDMKRFNINMLAFPGHKSLLGPQGIGMLLVEGDIQLEPIHHGGTGILSEQATQPKQWPHRYESGTLNSPAIAGLSAALYVYEKQRNENVSRETFLMKRISEGLTEIEGITIYKNVESTYGIPVIAFNVKNIPSQEIAMILDSHYGISVRAGIHCNPLCHKSYKTLEQGMVRVSINSSNTEEEIEKFLEAMREITVSY